MTQWTCLHLQVRINTNDRLVSVKYLQYQIIHNFLCVLFTAIPDPPENLKWRDKSASKIFLSWEPPKWDGGTAIKGYIVDKCQRGTDKWEPCGDPVPDLK